MMTSTTFLSLLKACLFPPGGVATALLVSILISRWAPRTGFWLGVVSVIMFIVLSMPRVSVWLSHPNEQFSPITTEQWHEAQAIVVLGGGRSAPIPGQAPERINLDTFARVAKAAELERKTHLPILLTGGRPGGELRSEAELMKNSLQENFGIHASWLENNSRNTRENAQLSLPLLRANHIHTIVVVTTAFHMARAKRNFERCGFRVLAAPSGFSTSPPGIMGWFPSALGLAQSQRALQEYVGWWVGR